MKKACLVLLCLGIIIAGIFLSGCTVDHKKTINYQRKLQQYLPSTATTTEQKPASMTIDLSEGPKTKYDANLGPQDLDFDMKLKTQY